MGDITLDTISTLDRLSGINDNFDTIESVINEEVLHTQGGNNVMSQSLDMNGRRILNVPQPTSPTDIVRLQDLEGIVTSGYTDASLITYTPAGTGAEITTVQAKLRESVSVKDFGAVGDGSTDDTAAFVSAIAAGPVWIPNGTYRITDTVTLPTSAWIVGESQRGVVIQSEVVGASLFDTASSGVSFMYIANMTCEGNNLTGASGNGHCFNFIDPAISSGSNTPQLSLLENIYIRRFRGTDDADNGGVTKVASAGVICYDTLGLTLRNVFVQTCGHGFYMRATQNCRITDCKVEGMQKAGVFSYANQNLVIENCDIIECGDGSTDSGYPVTDAGMGNVVSYEDDNVSLIGSKLKSHYGDAIIVVKGNTQNFTVERCWIRGTAIGDVQYRGIYAERISGLIIRNNLFYPTAGDYYGSQTYRAIDLYTPSSAPAFESTIEGNVFMDPQSLTTEFNIGIRGDSTSRLHRTTIRNNRFGSNATVSNACTVTRDIYLNNCLIEASYIGYNSHYAATNVTRTACVEADTINLRKSFIGPSIFTSGGGTITANYTGTVGYATLHESELWGTAAYTSPSMADGDRVTTTVTVTGASIDNGDIVHVSYTENLQGIRMWGYISAADTVTVVFENNTGGTVNTADGAIYVKVESFRGTML